MIPETVFVGSLLGTFVGDALGMPFEGMQPEDIAARWPNDRPMMPARLGRGTYTDDTQMMISVAESLAEHGRFDGRDMSRRFIDNFEPTRGYGAGTVEVLAAINTGTPWDQAGTVTFPDGSFGNGAAMRVAPVGLFYHHDLQELRRVAELSASISHAHPLGKEGAAIQAAAVALAADSHGGAIDALAFGGRLRTFARSQLDDYQQKLAALAELLGENPQIDATISRLGHDVRAHASVPAAIYSFLSHAESFREAVVFAVLLGGDTDTIAAMTGAIAGARHGIDGIPTEWLDALERGANGRKYVEELATRLWQRHLELDGDR